MKTRRTGAVTQEGKLPQISEYATPSTFPNLDLPPEKRLSFTPEMTRKMPMPLAVSKSLDLSNLPQWRQASKMVPLQNLLDGTELHDRLHNQEMKVGVLLSCQPIFHQLFPVPRALQKKWSVL